MIKIKTLLVDDEPLSQKHLKSILQKNCPELEVVDIVSNSDDALEKIYSLKPDLIFLDIELGGESGFDLLKKCPTRNFEVIFVTAHNQFGIEAVKAQALDYVLKPINSAELMIAVEKAILSIRVKKAHINASAISKVNSRISLPTMEGLIFVAIDDIIFIESEGRYSRFHLNNSNKILVSKNLGEYENEMEQKGFARIHHSYIVNLNYVEKYIKGRGGYVVLKNGKTLEVSSRKKDDFFDKIE